MSFNADHVRSIRNARNSQARVSAPSRPQSPFIEPRQLTDGDHYFRIWPDDPVKNPFGHLYSASHVCHRQWKDGAALPMEDPFEFSCPRSNNWDPVPVSWAEGTESKDSRSRGPA